MQTPDAVRSTDRAFPQQDLGPLAWVLDELRKSLDGAVKSVKLFAHNVAQAGPADAAALDPVALRIARQHLRSVLVTRMGGLHKLVDSRFHGAHHQRGFTHAHHFQRASGRVQMLAGDAQGPRRRHVVCKKLDGFDCAVE